MIKELPIRSKARTEFINITHDVQKVVEELKVEKGVCYLYVPHTTAAITINEGADPSVIKDIDELLIRLVPFNGGYRHTEGNSSAHIKASLLGPSEILFVERGRLVLGTWQSVFFCEFDGPRSRRVNLKFIKEE